MVIAFESFPMGFSVRVAGLHLYLPDVPHKVFMKLLVLYSAFKNVSFLELSEQDGAKSTGFLELTC
jgi:hypothetical protein